MNNPFWHILNTRHLKRVRKFPDILLVYDGSMEIVVELKDGIFRRVNKNDLCSDIFVLPSFTESCPLTILEAMSTGLPVIASNVGGISEMIKNNQDGNK